MKEDNSIEEKRILLFVQHIETGRYLGAFSCVQTVIEILEKNHHRLSDVLIHPVEFYG